MGFKWLVIVADCMSAHLPLRSTRGNVCLLITIIQHFPSETLIKSSKQR